ncbi:helix-turn-helix domain-containing protein [Flavobacterium sp.]|uniref:helix-turn-helix domain-containing protein n=1 Tax=Flavobacterium sp. TaxID=239 RepID=UPI003D6C14E3
MILLKEGEYFGKNTLAQEDANFKLSLQHYTPNFSISEHYHENDYISILTKGVYQEKSKKQESGVEAGNILFRPKDYNHSNAFTNCGGSCFNIEFKKDWDKNLDFGFRLPSGFENYKTGNFASFYKLIHSFLKNEAYENQTELIYDWLFQINQNTAISSRQPWIEKVKTILENEFAVFHSLASLSDLVFVHPVYLSGAFKKKTGLTVSEYQLEMKLKNAMHLLLTTTLPINEIGFNNGFFDDAHFIHSFKNRYNVSPHQFRQALKS